MENSRSFFLQRSIVILLFLFFFVSVTAEAKTRKKQKVEVIKVDTTDIVKKIVPKAPVVPFRDTIYYVHGSAGAFTPSQRAEAISNRIRDIEDDYSYDEAYMKLVAQLNGNVDIIYQEQVIASVDSLFAESVGKSRLETAEDFRDQIVDAIHKQREETSTRRIVIEVLLVLLIVAIEFLFLKGLYYVYLKLAICIRSQRDKTLKGVSTLINSQQQVYLILYILRTIRFITVCVSLYFFVWGIFKVFPHTVALADTLLDYVLSPLRVIVSKIRGYTPNIFTILVIVSIFWYIRKILRSIAERIAKGSISIKGFYSDWAFPTFHIISVMLFVFMFILIYPYLPASDSSVFQGVSVFAGVLISLGSTSVIGNLIAGLVITYMRPFRIGDSIKMDDCTGSVIEKTALVTRVRTSKNEVITIPNSSVMNSKTTNYSQSARQYGLILYTSITVGYDVPWQTVHELLLKVASETDNLVKKQKAFVLQTALDDFNVEYQLNVYTKDADKMSTIYSDLRKNIQDAFREAGIDLSSPPYYQFPKNMA